MTPAAMLLPEWLGMFAWPWWLAALPLPLLARWLLPRRRAQGAALRVPWGERLQAVAAATHSSARRNSANRWRRRRRVAT